MAQHSDLTGGLQVWLCVAVVNRSWLWLAAGSEDDVWGSLRTDCRSRQLKMMQADRDQLQSHPRAFLCPQHCPAAMGSTAQAGQALAQGGHTVNQAANEPREEEEV